MNDREIYQKLNLVKNFDGYTMEMKFVIDFFQKCREIKDNTLRQKISYNFSR